LSKESTEIFSAVYRIGTKSTRPRNGV